MLICITKVQSIIDRAGDMTPVEIAAALQSLVDEEVALHDAYFAELEERWAEDEEVARDNAMVEAYEAEEDGRRVMEDAALERSIGWRG